MSSCREPSVAMPQQQEPSFCHRKMKSNGSRDCLPSTVCVYQALFGALPALPLIPNSPGTGTLLLSWNLSFLITKMVLKCLSPGLKSASTHHVAFLLLVVKHFDSYPRLSHWIVGGFNGVNGKHLQGEDPDWARTSGSCGSY